MKARVKWVEGAAFVGEAGSGHALVIDGPPDIGGRNLGPRPMELMLLAIGSCAAVDVIHILRKARQGVTDAWVDVDGTRAESDPKVFTAVHLNFVVCGRDLSESHVRRAVELSAEKYCSASIMVKAGGCRVTHAFEMRREPDRPATSGGENAP